MAKRTTRIYTRTRNGVTRFYLDLRSLGGTQEALVAPGDRSATTDSDIAADLAAKRIKAFREEKRVESLEGEETKRRRIIDGLAGRWGLKAYSIHHLRKKARSGEVTDRWLEQTQRQLQSAAHYFGEDRDVASITVDDVQGYIEQLKALSNGRGGVLSPGSQRHYLNSLSNLFRRAHAERVVTPGFNPVAGLLEKPRGKSGEARWLEVDEAALLLEAARTYRADPDAHVAPIYPLIATFLLTGGRTSEVLGLQVDDLSFQRSTITFRPNEWRRLKTKTSHRSVRLWPQLEAILRAYLLEKEREGGLGRLLFPSGRGTDEAMIRDFRKALDAVAMRAGWARGEIRSKMFRHTYCSARLQTLDRGAPVSPFTVSRELGHGGTSMVEQVYSHLGQVRHRSEVVEFRAVGTPNSSVDVPVL